MTTFEAKIEAYNKLNALITAQAPRIFAELEKFNGQPVFLTDRETLNAKVKKVVNPIFAELHSKGDGTKVYLFASYGNFWVKFVVNHYFDTFNVRFERDVFFGQQARDTGFFQADATTFQKYLADAAHVHTFHDITQRRQAYEQKAQEAQEIFNSIPRELREYLPTIGR